MITPAIITVTSKDLNVMQVEISAFTGQPGWVESVAFVFGHL